MQSLYEKVEPQNRTIQDRVLKSKNDVVGYTHARLQTTPYKGEGIHAGPISLTGSFSVKNWKMDTAKAIDKFVTMKLAPVIAQLNRTMGMNQTGC